MTSKTPPRIPTAEQAAAMPPALWLAGTLGPTRRDRTVVRWASEHDRLVRMPTGIRWDAIELAATTGLPLLHAFLHGHCSHRIGPVLSDTRTAQTYWLIPPGSAADWTRLHTQTRLLPVDSLIEVPDPTPGIDHPTDTPVVWAHWPVVNGTLTSAPWLGAALVDVSELAAELPRVRPARAGESR